MMGRNLGLVSNQLYHIVVSWQMLLIYIGFNLLTKKNFAGSFILFAVGVYYLLPRVWFISDMVGTFFWPIVLIVVGLLFIATVSSGNAKKRYQHTNFGMANQTFEEGYYRANSSFGSIKQAFTDEVFKGGYIKASFGGVELDLRRTTLPEGTVFLDLDVNFGGVEVYIPSDWVVKSEMQPLFGGFEDSRIAPLSRNERSTLVIRGNVAFGGIEIKS